MEEEMKTMTKRTAVAALTGVMAVGMLTGCGEKKLDGTKTVATVDGTEIPLGIVSLSVREGQAQTEAMYKSVIEPYRTFKSAIEKNEFTKLVELSECGYRPSSELIRLLSGTFSESTSVALQKIFGMEVFASSNIQLRIDLPDSDVMSRQQSNVIEQSV